MFISATCLQALVVGSYTSTLFRTKGPSWPPTAYNKLFSTPTPRRHNQAHYSRAREARVLQYSRVGAYALGWNVITLPERALTGKLTTAETKGSRLAKTSVRTVILVSEESQKKEKLPRPFTNNFPQSFQSVKAYKETAMKRLAYWIVSQISTKNKSLKGMTKHYVTKAEELLLCKHRAPPYHLHLKAHNRGSNSSIHIAPHTPMSTSQSLYLSRCLGLLLTCSTPPGAHLCYVRPLICGSIIAFYCAETLAWSSIITAHSIEQT